MNRKNVNESQVALSLSSPVPAFPTAAANAWAFFEVLRGLRGDRTPLGGFSTDSFLVAGEPADALDRLQSSGGWVCHWAEVGLMLLVDGERIVEVNARRRGKRLCQITVEARGPSPADAKAALLKLRESFAGFLVEPPEQFIVTWAFRGGKNDLQTISVEEILESSPKDAAYPTLAGGVGAFIDAYLESPECVLVLQGPPGTGKTQLIRSIAAAISRRKGSAGDVLYANDATVLQSDEFFVRFALGEADALVLEDADQQLLPRSRGNPELHRMLSVSDGVIRAQGRKMIFSTNLPNVRDLDEALVRPGRCFECVRLRALTTVESVKLLSEICADSAHSERATGQLMSSGLAQHSVAEIYRAAREALANLPGVSAKAA